MIAPYLPELWDFAGLAVTWAVGVVLGFAGSALAGRRTGIECRMLAGWGALCILLTVWGVLIPASLRYPAIAFVVLAAATQLFTGMRLQRSDWQALGRMMVLTLPLWIVMAPIRPSQPDTFLNLLPNAMYLVDYARLPTAASPPSFSFLPAAPYNEQFLAYLGSLLDNSYPAAGLSLANVLLQLAAGLGIARALGSTTLQTDGTPSWRLTALGFLIATLLNPGFVPRFNFSAYGETALSVTAMFAVCLFVERQAELAAGRMPSLSTPLSLILAAMVNTKQSGSGLVAAILGAAATVGWLERGVSRPRLLRSLLIPALPALLLFGLWRYFVARAGVAELTPRALTEWNWSVVPAMLASAGRIIGEKGVYFGCVAVAVASLPVLLRRFGWTTTTRLLAFHAAVFALYNVYIMATYIAHFSPEMSAEAHSYFRYNTHLSLLLSLALALVVRDLASSALGRAPRYRELAGAGIIALALLAPIGFAYRLRFDLVMPQPLVWDLAKAIKPRVPQGGRLALLLPGDNGSVDAMLTGLLKDVPPRRRDIDLLHRSQAGEAALAEAERLGYALALVSCTAEGEAALLQLRGDGWYKVAAWRYPAEARREHWQQILEWEPLCRES